MSFVEEATLVTKDKTSSVIKAINKELMAMRKHTDALKSIKMDFNNTVLNRRLLSTTLLFSKLESAAKKANAVIAGSKLPTQRTPSYIAAIQKQLSSQSLAASATQLQGVKSIHIKFEMPGLTAATTETGVLLNNIRGLKKFSSVKLNVNAGSQGPGGSGSTSGVYLNIKPLQTMLHSFLWNLGYTIQSSIINGFREGTITQDVAESRLMLQGMTAEQVSMINKGVREIVRENPQLSTPNATALVSEMLTTAQGDPAVATQMAKLAAEMIKTQTILGVQSKQAEEQVLGFIKSAETGGFLTDSETGRYDPAKASAYFDVLTKGAIAIGQEFGAKMVGGFLKYAQTSKFPLDARGLVGGFLASEESGTSAGVGLNQAVKQLSGERITKKNLARMQDLGLTTVTEIDAAKAAAMSPDELTFAELFSKGAKNEEELRSNFYGWVRSTIIPAMIKGGMDPNNPQDAAKFAGAVTSDRTATNALSSAIIRSQEVDAIVTKTLAIDVSKQRIKDVENQSLAASVAAVEAQFQSTLGAIGTSFETILIPALNGAADALISLTNFISGGDGSGPSATRSIMAIGGGATAVYGGGLLAKKGLSFFNPLSVAGTTLTAAGHNLNLAATRILGMPSNSKGPDVFDFPDSDGNTSSKKSGKSGFINNTLMSIASGVASVAAYAMRNLVPVLATLSLGGDTPVEDGNTPESRARLAIANAKRDHRRIELAYTAGLIDGFRKPNAPFSEQMGMVQNPGRDASISGVNSGSSRRGRGIYVREARGLESTDYGFNDAAEQMRRVFSTSADDMARSTRESAEAASQAMMAAAPSIGDAIGRAAAAVISTVNVGVRQTTEQRAQPSYVPAQRAETGVMTPF